MKWRIDRCAHPFHRQVRHVAKVAVKFSRYFEDVLEFGGSDEDKLNADDVKEQMTKCHDALQELYESLTVAKAFSRWEEGE